MVSSRDLRVCDKGHGRCSGAMASRNIDYVQVACQLGEKACTFAKEDARKVICRPFPEDCHPTKQGSPAVIRTVV